MESASITSYGQQPQQVASGRDAFSDLNLDEFLGLLITELQTQDPLDPMDNNEILQQVSQMREIESNMRLTDTLQTVLLGQNMSTASSLINRVIVGLTSDGRASTARWTACRSSTARPGCTSASSTSI